MHRLLAVLLVLPAVCFAQPKETGIQYAFLVGCSGYPEAKLTQLPYTVNDIEQFRQALLDTGFKAEHMKMLHDKQGIRYLPESKKIVKEFGLFIAGLRPEDTVVVALSGHGVQLKKEGVSYFCPLDADLEDQTTLIALDGPGGLFGQLKACNAKRKLLIVNACRDVRVIAGKRAQAADKGDYLGDVGAAAVPEGVAAIYSCAAGQKSYFDPKREQGIFFDHVTRAWRGEYAAGQPDTSIEDFFREVSVRTKLDVDKTYGEAQVPEVQREYKGEWLVRRSVVRAKVDPKPTPMTVGDDPKPGEERAIEIAKGVKMTFCWIPKGKTTLGSPAGEKSRSADEKEHDFTTKGFWFGKYEVQQSEWEGVMGENPSESKGATLPVELDVPDRIPLPLWYSIAQIHAANGRPL